MLTTKNLLWNTAELPVRMNLLENTSEEKLKKL